VGWGGGGDGGDLSDTALHDEEVGIVDVELNGVEQILYPTAVKTRTFSRQAVSQHGYTYDQHRILDSRTDTSSTAQHVLIVPQHGCTCGTARVSCFTARSLVHSLSSTLQRDAYLSKDRLALFQHPRKEQHFPRRRVKSLLKRDLIERDLFGLSGTPSYAFQPISKQITMIESDFALSGTV
jgi:hypothetical protein